MRVKPKSHNDVSDESSVTSLWVGMRDKDAGNRRRRAFKAFMAARPGLEPAEWARRAGLSNPNQIYNFLNGLSQSLGLNTIEALATAEKVTIAHLFDESVTAVTTSGRVLGLYGFVQAGQWREIEELRLDEPKMIPVPAAEINFGESYLLEIRGDSMNEIYPHGTLVEVVDLPKYNFALASDDKVIVNRRDRNGLIEMTCKQFVLDDRGAWLRPRSTAPDHQEWISVPWPPQEADEDMPRADGIEAIWIVAIVVRAHKVEVGSAALIEARKKKIT